jgi:hypothetical protein
MAHSSFGGTDYVAPSWLLVDPGNNVPQTILVSPIQTFSLTTTYCFVPGHVILA